MGTRSKSCVLGVISDEMYCVPAAELCVSGESDAVRGTVVEAVEGPGPEMGYRV